MRGRSSDRPLFLCAREIGRGRADGAHVSVRGLRASIDWLGACTLPLARLREREGPAA